MRIPRGVPGPDVLIEIVLPSGDIAGRVCLDSKAISRWSNKYPTKLRSDQLATKSDFAILVSTVFPSGASGAREIHLQDGILVVAQNRVVVVMTFLRQQIIANHRLKLSLEQREEKGSLLLSFLTSAEADDHFDKLAKATDDLINLEAHQLDIETGIHRKRGEMIRTLQVSHEAITGAINRIIGSNQPPLLEAPR